MANWAQRKQPAPRIKIDWWYRTKAWWRVNWKTLAWTAFLIATGCSTWNYKPELYEVLKCLLLYADSFVK